MLQAYLIVLCDLAFKDLMEIRFDASNSSSIDDLTLKMFILFDVELNS
jgi:hypothetical protein